MAETRIFVMNFPPGTTVTLFQDGNRTEGYFVGGVTARLRPKSEFAGSSSPQWVDKIVISTDEDAAIRGAQPLAAARQAFGNPCCTGSSKDVQLILVDPDGQQKELPGFNVLVTAADYDLQPNPPVQNAIHVLISDVPFDPLPGAPPDTQEAKAWRAMSQWCEGLFANFSGEFPQQKSDAVTRP